MKLIKMMMERNERTLEAALKAMNTRPTEDEKSGERVHEERIKMVDLEELGEVSERKPGSQVWRLDSQDHSDYLLALEDIEDIFGRLPWKKRR